LPADAPANLYEPVPGDYAAHGRFDDEARAYSWELFTDRHRNAAYGAAVLALAGGVAWLLKRKRF
jgi:hypothetical protein